MRYAGKIALITGAGSPIGAAIARRLKAEGAEVALGDVSAESLAPVLAELGDDTAHLVGDLGDENVVANLVDIALKRFGRIDTLVNNAGGGIIRPFLDHTPETLRETVNRNLWTTLWCCHQILPLMVAANHGRVVNIGADSVRNGLYNHAGYNAAKGGVHGLTTGLAREFAMYDITINTVAPCMTATPAAIEGLASNPRWQRYVDVIPKGRPAPIEDVVGMVAYLASAENTFTTGQVVSVNGGSTML